MNYPLISEYVEAIKSAEDNFNHLKNLRPVLDEAGNPIMTSGNFAVVFKMEDPAKGKRYAVKCFIKDQDGRSEAYRLISEELKDVETDYLTSFQYLEKELFVDTGQDSETEYPVLVMDWVEGVTLDKFIRNNEGNGFRYIMGILAYRFSLLAEWLLSQTFAHGDLKPDNIIVRPGCWLTLVDYDGMYVPAMKGQKAREIGSPDFRHPARTENTFDEHIDGFPLISILVSLKALSLNSSLLRLYGDADRLLLSNKDYLNVSNSSLLKRIYPSSDEELNRLVALLLLSLAQQTLIGVSPIILRLKQPEFVSRKQCYELDTDEYGAKYYRDGFSLYKGPLEGCNTYHCIDGILRIDDCAFIGCDLKSISIPDSVICIGNEAFRQCEELSSVVIPNSVKVIGKYAFSECNKLTSIVLPDSIITIGIGAFRECENLSSVVIPQSITEIGSEMFCHCHSLNSIVIPESVRVIESGAFFYNTSLKSIFIPKSVSQLNEAFGYNWDLVSIKVDEGNPYYDSRDNCNAIIETKTGKLILGCQNTIIPNTVSIIGYQAFAGQDISTITIPDSVTFIEMSAFEESGITSISIPRNVSTIELGAFDFCTGLLNIRIPKRFKKDIVKLFPHVSPQCDIKYY